LVPRQKEEELGNVMHPMFNDFSLVMDQMISFLAAPKN
jgi:hypothetical protein